ncbi:hypothetical protein [Pedobacter sp. L105]|uniref:hypothetical protein n=1 Tax=Pedobacter sp. L105 TaxID=1641871 RepID=UPI00131DB24B|nr:hypothetical protein [Pedobacter sp. L105]
MKKLLFTVCAAVILFSGCGTVQSIIKSSFPYTTNLIIPATVVKDKVTSASSIAGSFDESVGNINGNKYIKEVRMASARLISTNPRDKSMGMFKSVKIFLSTGNSGEVMVASRNDISEHIGSELVLDIDNSRFLDKYVKGNVIKVRMEYVLRDGLDQDVSVKTSLGFSAAPKNK